MNVLFVASESVPFIKTGGLADVIGSLPKELNKHGVQARVILPKYGDIPAEWKDRMKLRATCIVWVGWRRQYCGIEEAIVDGVHYYFVDNEYYFKRDGLYGHYDDGERFAFFCRAVLEALPLLGFNPDVLHCHDWHAGMVNVMLKAHYGHLPYYQRIRTVFTIHNLKYQGVFPYEILYDLLGLDDSWFTSDKLEFYGGVSFMKGALAYSDILTTVSETYALEIQTPYFGERLDGLLRARSGSLTGIVNGIDYDVYNPETDPYLIKNYRDAAGKKENKAALQAQLGLPIQEDVPIISVVSRLVQQKGLDLIAHVLDEILSLGVQFVVLGTGDFTYEDLFRNVMHRYPDQVSAQILFNEGLARRIYAGSDMFLMPSQFEPCGIGQLISLRYGTLPIVRETGGLKDTVQPYNKYTGEGNGFSFANYNAHEMLGAIERAVDLYRRKPVWNSLIENANLNDNSWNESARRYTQLYQTL
ncbi:glycogen synthase GlgA [Aneurinibacillus sp. Ricciae_BoGa-3]|uniref:glycogen synthase GlgA n=1 Tax=Aneurinibacillus sp. Ricciae_BoGa-3 TaxID=3022697 RepID=UPI00233FEC17|nr:glycogen synthase GlgA [Aneurinibacillus sp. Ricciae_BoGa-3]WCK52695.1 glycogen synthase GlgA [Aneurinibacillus sp. Ricciae_BoGa-3]